VRGSHQGEGSPLVKTVTKIVDVVPAAIRILIGALVALGLALAAGSRLIALRARRLARQRRELLEDVGLLQGALLPALPARIGPVATSAAYRPAAGPAAGGDFYDVFALQDGQLGIIVGDLSGHGRQALPHTALVRFTLRAYLEAGMAPRDALQRAAAVLERQLTGFATVVAASYHPRDRVLTYSSAGHPPPVVVGAKPVTPITAASAPPIGAGLPTGTRQTVVSLPGWALACFYTDGVIEAKVGPEELYGPARLEQTLAELAPETTATALLDRVAAASNEHSDDMAACLLGIDGGSGQPSVQLEELELDSREAAGDRAERFLLACGVSAAEIPAIMRSARATVAKTGNVVLKLRLGEGPPQVSLRHDNVTFLDSAARQRVSSS
jgi:serine phosphatase RsbU (regulator of sigma subunit)